MSRTETSYYAHPYLTSNGMIGYKYYSFPCPDSKKWEVLGDALNISIPKLYSKVIDDESSSPELIEKATNLHNTWKTSLVPEQVPEQVLEEVPETKTFMAVDPTEKMDEHNRRIANIVKEKGWEEGAKEMMKGLTYSEMRSRYG